MIHQPLGGFSGQASDVEIHAKEMLRIKHELTELLAFHTGKPVKTVAEDSDRDFFMTAMQAKEYGLIDDVFEKRVVESKKD
jgi:ATP-dependent Clp protease protease subunit